MSLVITVLNEAESIETWLATVHRQTRQPDEIVVVDAGSQDGTTEILERAASADAGLRLVTRPGVNISQGRNAGIREARHELIAVTDAGTELAPDWLQRLLEPFSRDSAVDVVAGFFRPAGRNNFERALSAVITPRLAEVNPETFLPSSRSVAFRRPAWRRAGGYPDWLRTGEDLVFDMRLKAAGAKFGFAPDAIVSWYPSPDLRRFFRQYRHYARGDGHARLFPERQAARYGAYSAGLALLALGRTRLAPRVLLPVGFALHIRRYLSRLWAEYPFAGLGRMAWATALVPVIAVVGDVAKMIGYAQGRWELWRAGSEANLEHVAMKSHRSFDESGAESVRQR